MKVILIAADTLRPDHLSCYGYKHPTSPNIDRLAEQGTLFTNAYASDVPTIPSFTSLLTGQRGITTGVVAFDHSEDTIPDTIPMLAQVLAEKGIKTAAVSTLYSFKKWFARGFEYYIRPAIGRNLQFVVADEINSYAIPWLRQNYKEDFFLFLHYWDAHVPYIPPDEYKTLFYQGNPKDPANDSLDEWRKQPIFSYLGWILEVLGEGITDINYVIAQYDAEIKYLDTKIGELLTTLENLHIMDDTIIIFLSDHGESLGEHKFYFDHLDVYDGTIKVPLIIRHAYLSSQAHQVPALVQLTDVAPTIIDIFNISKVPSWKGVSLLDICQKGEGSIRDAIYTNTALATIKRCMRQGEWKIVYTIDECFWPVSPVELYNLREDPGETENLVDKNPKVKDRLELKLKRWVESKLNMRPDPLRLKAQRGILHRKFFKEATKAKLRESTRAVQLSMEDAYSGSRKD